MRKKLFAVIMSAMMMITFMPSMAFATAVDSGTTPVWNKDYTSVDYVVGGKDFSSGVDRYIDRSATTGVTAPDGTAACTFDGYVLAAAYNNSDDVKTSYIDLNYASATEVGTVALGAGQKSMTYDEYETMMENTTYWYGADRVIVSELTLSEPSYISNRCGYDESAVWSDIGGEMIPGYFVYAGVTGYDEDKKFEDQKITITPYVALNTTTPENIIGSIKPISITVKAKEAKAADATYKLVDAICDPGDVAEVTADGGYMYAYYDGAEHKVEQSKIPGVTSTYEVWNEEKHTFVAVSSEPTFKDVSTTGYVVRATAKDSKTTSVKTFYIEIAPSGELEYTFDAIESYGVGNVPRLTPDSIVGLAGGENAFYVGNNFDPADFVGIGHSFLVNEKAFNKAIKADKDILISLFNDVYEVEKEESKYDKNVIIATITGKDTSSLSDAEKKALYKKYETVEKNYDFSRSVGTRDSAVFYVKDSIKFTKAPLNKTFKAKNGKLAKAKKFSVKAKAQSGAKVTYKLKNGGSRIVINKNTGKVTCKKGLKKRTYNVKITATAGTYVGTTESFTVKIKIK